MNRVNGKFDPDEGLEEEQEEETPSLYKGRLQGGPDGIQFPNLRYRPWLCLLFRPGTGDKYEMVHHSISDFNPPPQIRAPKRTHMQLSPEQLTKLPPDIYQLTETDLLRGIAIYELLPSAIATPGS